MQSKQSAASFHAASHARVRPPPDLPEMWIGPQQGQMSGHHSSVRMMTVNRAAMATQPDTERLCCRLKSHYNLSNRPSGPRRTAKRID